jgi:hypothetical protein
MHGKPTVDPQDATAFYAGPEGGAGKRPSLASLFQDRLG